MSVGRAFLGPLTVCLGGLLAIGGSVQIKAMTTQLPGVIVVLALGGCVAIAFAFFWSFAIFVERDL